MKSIKQMLIIGEISFTKACKKHYNELTKEDVGYIAEKEPWYAARLLNQHPFLTKEHFDYLVEKTPYFSAAYLRKNSCFTQRHVDFIVKKEPWSAVTYLSHMLSEENIAYIAENHPEQLKDIFR